MASPAAAELTNGISTPPTTASGGQNPSPATASSTQPNTQSQSQSQPLSQPALTNGQPATAQAPPSQPLTSLQDDGLSKRPQDARTVHLVLAKLGVHAYTERVPLQLMDFAYRYVSGVLSDAIAYDPPLGSTSGANSKKKDTAAEDGTVSLSAVRTAIAARVANQFNPALPKDFMTELAAERNRIALPRVDREFGVRLPPERYCFTGVGWGLKESWEGEEEEEVEDEAAGMAGGPVGGALDTVMGGMEEEEMNEDEFEVVMGTREDATMADG